MKAHEHEEQDHDKHSHHQHHDQGAAQGDQPAEHHGHGHHGHDHSDLSSGDHHRMMIADFRRRFWISLGLTVPVLLLAPMIQQLTGLGWSFPGSSYLLFALATVVFIYGGKPFLVGLYQELRAKAPGMMTLIGLAIGVAYVYSSAVVFGLAGKTFFWELVTLIDIMLVGHWIEMRSILGASRALELLVQMMPSEAHLVQEDSIEDVGIERIQNGDLILIRPGEKSPADGTIESGESFFNDSMITGESKPVQKKTGDRVIGGSINGDGSVQVRVEGTGADSYIARVINMVREAQGTKSKTQRLADRAAALLAYVAVSAGLITFAAWLLAGYDLAFALERTVTVMVISCPHALGLAVPLVVAISTALAARQGLLIRNRTAFESARRISTVVFDKTGTLTMGNFGVSRILSLSDEFSESDVLGLAAALESHSEHPIAAGIVARANESKMELENATDFRAIPGKGAAAMVGDRNIKVVSPGFLKENQFEIPREAEADDSETVVFVIADDELIGLIALSDQVRPESAGAIDLLKQAGIRAMMATGDNKTVAAAVSKQLKLDGFFAEVLPDEKLKIVRELQEQGQFVAMTGDGVNDAPALAQADVGIAVGSGTDVAAETADIILVESNPRDITALIFFGRATHRKMIQNLIWATAYNVLAIPVAGGVLYSWGILLSPAVGAVFMSLSTIIVALNAQLLKRHAKFAEE